MKRILSVTLSLVFLATLFAVPGMAKPVFDPGTQELIPVQNPAPGSMNYVSNGSAREDTLFLFPASGDGAYGMPGTTERGWNFDYFNGSEVEAAYAGWYGIDVSVENTIYWHVEDVSFTGGWTWDADSLWWVPDHRTNMDSIPTADGTNNYAAWCGAQSVCEWKNSPGYGNKWKQYMIVDLAEDTSLTLDCWYSLYIEGATYDNFQILVEIGNFVDGDWVYEWTQVLMDETPIGGDDWNEVGGDIFEWYVHVQDTYAAADFGGERTRDLAFYVWTDTGWADEDGAVTDIGAVWVDNISIESANNSFFTDFESGTEPAEISFWIPAGAQVYAELYQNLRAEDPCTLNPTFAWAFFDILTTDGSYGNHPLINNGPPYVDNRVVSPVLDTDQFGNTLGEDFFLSGDTSVIFDFWAYRDLPDGCLIYMSYEMGAVVEDVPCVKAFEHSPYIYFGDWKVWENWVVDVTTMVNNSADDPEAVIEGLVARLRCLDYCEYLCGPGEPGLNHPPGPYFDNMSVYIVEGSATAWAFEAPDRFQDSYPEANGFVRMEHAGDWNWGDLEEPLSIVDSLLIEFTTGPGDSILEVFDATAGEIRPAMYMWYRIVDGPNAGDLSGDSGDPLVDLDIFGDATDGHCYSPWIGTDEIETGDGEFWNIAVADYAHYNGSGSPNEDEYAFDLNDAFFEPGDEIQYFFTAETAQGENSVLPGWAMSSDLDLRSAYTVRALPAGNQMLFVDDGYALGGFTLSTIWREALTYNGYIHYDRYFTQAPSSGQHNGLGSRASLQDLEGYLYIIWDCGYISGETICDEDDKTRDDMLLTSWIEESEHAAYLWVLGDNVANDLADGDPFLTNVLGADLIESNIFYDDVTGNLAPYIYGTADVMEYLGGDPHFLIYGSCPVLANFALVAPTGTYASALQDWEDDPGDNAKPSILNEDPDQNGTLLNNQGYPTKVVFNAYSLYPIRDTGYGLPADEVYSKLYVGHILDRIFSFTDSAPNDVPETPAFTRLDGNFPNPFNPKTTIRFSTAHDSAVNLTVYDITGRVVKTLVDRKLAADNHEIVWDGTNNNGDRASSGVYFYKLMADDKVFTDKMVMLK